MTLVFMIIEDAEGADIAVNIKEITYLQPAMHPKEDRCYINFTSGKFVEVPGTLDEVLQKIDKAGGIARGA